MRQWYVVNTQPAAEHKALAHLHRQGFDVYLPRYLKRRSHARRIDWVAAPLFPRYLFVDMDLDSCRWRAIGSTVGVVQLVGFGRRPTPLPAAVIDELKRREDEKGLITVRHPDGFRPGDAVQLTDGPLRDIVGLFDCASDDDRVVVLLSFLGRDLRVAVQNSAVVACH